MSHLLQMRGLKLDFAKHIRSIYVASFTDAWIETSFHPHRHSKKVSHLLQMRGLKQNVTLLHLRR
ncbi:hypothetical protein PARMER_04162 [Parabacteroides merdae ATCC 43184]|nr:hypothetical protein PARMER_04162 [Parabacteroides merdae ATCC 43184]